MSKERIKKIIYFILAGLASPLIFEPIGSIIGDIRDGFLTACIDHFYYKCGHQSSTEILLTFTYAIFLCIVAVPILTNFVVSVGKLYTSKKVSASEPLISSNKKEYPPKKLNKHIEIIMVVYFAISLLSITVYGYAPCLFSEKFEREITKIVPYVDDDQIDMLRSKWVSMETKSDYDVIWNKIEDIKQENALQ